MYMYTMYIRSTDLFFWAVYRPKLNTDKAVREQYLWKLVLGITIRKA